MKEVFNKRNANAHTLNGMCKAFTKKYKGLVLSCMPVNLKNGVVEAVRVTVIEPISKTKIDFRFNLDGEDILDSVDNINLISLKIQDLCENIGKNTTN